MSLASKLVNVMFKKGDTKRDKGLVDPKDVIRVDNLNYGNGLKENLLDVYYPENSTTKNPVIVNVHGGGWVYGDKEVYQYYCMNLAQKGFTVINFNYHLAPKHKFPIQLNDINLVITWIYQNADIYFMDLNAINLVGDSAGAHFAALYSCVCTNKEYAQTYMFSVPQSFVPSRVVLNCGVYDIEQLLQSNKIMKSIFKDLLGKKYTKEDIKNIDVLNNINSDFPETYLMSATGDFMLEQFSIFVQKLKDLEIPHTSKVYGTELNKLPHVFHCDIKTADATLCNDEETKFLLNTKRPI